MPEPVADPALMTRAAQRRRRTRSAPQLTNDLQDAAISLRPDLGEVLAAGMEYGALGGIVSGSGPTTAFLVEDNEAGIDLAVALTAERGRRATSAGPAVRSTAPTSSTTGSTSGQPRLRRARLPRRSAPPQVLDAVSLGVGGGDRIGVVGRNGGGKTTLLRVLAGPREVDSGRVARVGWASPSGCSPRTTRWTPRATVHEAVIGDLPEHVWAADARIRDVLTGLLGGIDAPAVGGMSAPSSARSRVASAAGSRSPRCSSPRPTCCCSTSRPTTSTSRGSPGSPTTS